MPPVIVDMPWPPDTGEDLVFPDGMPVTDPTSGRPFRVRHDQIILWASLTPRTVVALPPGFPMFPVLLDTGFNDAFLMQQRQAEVWMTPSGIAQLPLSGSDLVVGSARIPGREAILWLHPNVPGTREPDLNGTPVRLGLPIGAALTPPGSAYAREKPLLGLLAVRFNRLVLRIDGGRERGGIDSP